jgi:hypothetical protein
MRDSSLWTYPVVNLTHILGIASLFGATLIIDLRLLGLWRRVPLAPLTDAAVPVAAGGFFVAVTTGTGLLATKRALSRAEDRQLAVMGGCSLMCWLAAVAAGRLIAYW